MPPLHNRSGERRTESLQLASRWSSLAWFLGMERAGILRAGLVGWIRALRASSLRPYLDLGKSCRVLRPSQTPVLGFQRTTHMLAEVAELLKLQVTLRSREQVTTAQSAAFVSGHIVSYALNPGWYKGS